MQIFIRTNTHSACKLTCIINLNASFHGKMGLFSSKETVSRLHLYCISYSFVPYNEKQKPETNQTLCRWTDLTLPLFIFKIEVWYYNVNWFFCVKCDTLIQILRRSLKIGLKANQNEYADVKCVHNGSQSALIEWHRSFEISKNQVLTLETWGKMKIKHSQEPIGNNILDTFFLYKCILNGFRHPTVHHLIFRTISFHFVSLRFVWIVFH